MIAALLPALARDLNVGLPAAGHLVTAFSLAYAIGAPVMAVLTPGIEDRGQIDESLRDGRCR
jgi:predicted MFS family arabinose efflux permease